MKNVKILLLLVIGGLLMLAVNAAFDGFGSQRRWGNETFPVGLDLNLNWSVGKTPFGLCPLLEGNLGERDGEGPCVAQYIRTLPTLSNNGGYNFTCEWDARFDVTPVNSFAVFPDSSNNSYGTHAYRLISGSAKQAKIRVVSPSADINIPNWVGDGTWQNVIMQFLNNMTVRVCINNTNDASCGQSTESTINASYITPIYIDTANVAQIDNFTCYNSTTYEFTPPDEIDTINAEVNISLNNTQLSGGIHVNVTGNSSDNNGLFSCIIVTNQTGFNVFYNFSLNNATSGYCGQNITMVSTNVVNFTVIVNDTSNRSDNKVQAEYIISLGDTTPPILNNFNFSNSTSFSIVDGNKINLTINVSDTQSPINEIRFNFTNPNNINFSRVNPTHFSMPSNQLNVNLTYTFFSGSETSVVGKWNLTYISIKDNAGNLFEFFPNQTIFTVSTPPSGGSSQPVTGGGGGGGNIIEEIIILGNATFTLQPTIISTYFLYTPFKNATQRFSIELTANRILDKCISPIFECKISNNTVTVALNYSNDKDFFNKVNSSITLIDKGNFAKTISASVRFINIAYALPLSLDTASTNYAIFKLQNGLIDGIRLWFIITAMIMVGSGVYIYTETR